MARFGTFFDGVLTRLELACIASFLRLGHQITVFSYGSLDLPPGALPGEAAEIVPKDEFYRIGKGQHRGSPSQFSDHFRYRMLKRTELIWVDTDIFCLRPDWPDLPFLFAGQDQCLVNGAVLRIPADHPLLDDAIEVSRRLASIPIWAYTGPHLLTALVNEYELGRHVLPSISFYPVHFTRAGFLLSPLAPGRQPQWPEGAYCVHFWNELLRINGFDKTAPPPAGSPMAMMFDLAAPYLWRR